MVVGVDRTAVAGVHTADRSADRTVDRTDKAVLENRNTYHHDDDLADDRNMVH